MSILVIGVNHRSGPLSVLERVALAGDEIPKAVERLAARDNVREVVLVSTCNRTEVYAVAEKFHGAYADIRDFFCEVGDISADELYPHLYSHHDDAAVTHLFEVAAGLDSAVVGETEILGQVRHAWEIAQREGAARTTMNLLFRHAIGVGKRARTETGIARGTASVSHAAVEMAIERLGGLDGRRVAVIGAGAMGEGIAVALRRSGTGEVVVVNRTPERGDALGAPRRRVAPPGSTSSATCSPTPTSRSPAPGRASRSSPASSSTPPWPAAPSARCCSSTSPCPATSPPTCTVRRASWCSTSTT